MTVQDQFLNVVDRDEAERRFRAALDLAPLAAEEVTLEGALDRVLAADVVAGLDVPSFDRSNFDGFAVRAADTFGADEQRPRRLRLLDQTLATGVVPQAAVTAGSAASIATGAMLPRGADAVVMVEHTDARDGQVLVRRPVAAGDGVSFAGSDIAAGEIVLRRCQPLTSRETGVLAALGMTHVSVWRQPRVAILSTGDEIIPPGEPMRPPKVYDSNGRILADAVRELGGVPLELGIVADDLAALARQLDAALAEADVVLLSGGTSKGAGDLSYRAVARLGPPGIVAHGVALKPGKPLCLAVQQGKAVAVLPGFPTSAIFTFHEFVAPVILALGGRAAQARATRAARLAVKVGSEAGRTEYLLVRLLGCDDGLLAWPMGKGSGSVTAFSQADGFIAIDRHCELVDEGTPVEVQLLGRHVQPADLVVIGSHCVGLDWLLGRLEERGLRTSFLAVGSTAGLRAAKRGECDVAGIHLLDPVTGQYNRPLLTAEVELIAGYGRMQGVVFRPGDRRFAGRTAGEAIAAVRGEADCVMVNRNQGSGTRILIDQLLAGAQPPGYALQPRSHNAVAAAVAQGRADWGVAIEWVARHNGLGFLPLVEEQYDFVVPASRRRRVGVQALEQLLAEAATADALGSMGFTPKPRQAGGRK